MCRLFGQISVEPVDAYDYLVSSSCSLLTQSRHQAGRRQKDGWGIACYGDDTQTPKISKSPNAVFNEERRFKRIAERARSRIIIAHIRKASNPLNLPAKSLLGRENTQPFSWGPFVFAHNGSINIVREVFNHLGRFKNKVWGVNDSEVYFWQIIKHLEACGSVLKALESCIREMHYLWLGRTGKGAHQRKKIPYTGLNMVLSDGKVLYALCHYPYTGKDPWAICAPNQRWGRMSFTVQPQGQALTVSSERMTTKGWRLFGDPEVLEARIKGKRIRWTKHSIELPKKRGI